jgi:RNA recognition motif-containing protein
MGKFNRSDRNPTFTLDATTYALQISNLHWNVSEEDLKQLFGDYKGFLSVKLKYDKAGRSLGEAVVVYEMEESADAALQFFDNRQFDGMPISVRKLESRIKHSKSLINSRLGPSTVGVGSRLGPSVNTRLGPKSSEISVTKPHKEKARKIVSYEQV